MRAGRLPAVSLALAALLGAGAVSCGPYGELGQKLDVTRAIAGGETWLARSGTELRALVLGPSAGGAAAGFSLTSMDFPVTSGAGATALQGEWTDQPAGGTATFVARRAYRLPDERGIDISLRHGVTRQDVSQGITVQLQRPAPGRLVLAGDPAFAGTYVRFQEALGALGSATAHDAACAFQVANLGIRAMESRIIAFNSIGMTTYRTPAEFNGTLAGHVRVSLSLSDGVTNVQHVGLVELSGLWLDGPQRTNANVNGNGEMSGVLAFRFEPVDAAGAALPVLAGTIDYGGGGDPTDAVHISGGDPVSGHYVISLQGGGSARVSPADAPPTPTVAECLSVP